MIETMGLPGRVSMSVDVTEPRETPPPPERRFAEALAAGVETLAAGAGELVAAALPGGGTGEGGGIDDYWRLQQQSQDFNLQFLQLQEGLSQENRRFTTMSNVLKARHETVKNVIQNIR